MPRHVREARLHLEAARRAQHARGRLAQAAEAAQAAADQVLATAAGAAAALAKGRHDDARAVGLAVAVAERVLGVVELRIVKLGEHALAPHRQVLHVHEPARRPRAQGLGTL